MKQDRVITILRSSQLSVTASRRRILEMFLQSGSAMAHHDVERQSSGKFDRVTVYRTLQTFLEKGIIHTIPTTDNSVLYALCKDECEEGHHHDNHVHFVCDVCGATTCMDELVIPTVRLPSGYRSSSIHMVVNGTCKSCNG
jgi:Fur family ferric uptake transcriptional regulator